MAYKALPLVSKRMRNLLGCALGKSVAATTTAIGSTASDLSTAGTGVMFLPNGALSAAVAATNIDLSDSDVCKEAGLSIPAGRDIYIFILQDGTNVKARVGQARKITTRTGATGALTTTIKHDVVPDDVDNETYVVTGYCKLVNTTNPFVIGTTLLSATGVTDTFKDLTNALAGSRIA